MSDAHGPKPVELPYSEVRQAFLPAFEARLYKERANLEPAEAVRWWERYVLSGEARDAIADGLDVEQAAERAHRRMAATAHQSISAEVRVQRALVEMGTGTGLVIRTGDDSIFRIRPDGDAVEVDCVDMDPDGRRVARGPDLAAAVALLADELSRLGRTVAAIDSRGLPDGFVLTVIQQLAVVAMEHVSVDGRRVAQFAGHLVPVDPTEWPGSARHGLVIESVGELYLVRDVDGRPVHAGIGVGAAACEALRVAAAQVALVEVRRSTPGGSSAVRARERNGSIVVTGDGGDEVVLEPDVLVAFRALPNLHEVRCNDVTEIVIHPLLDGTGVAEDLRVVVDEDPVASADLAWPEHLAGRRADVLPPEVVAPAVWINKKRWAGVHVEGRNGAVLVPVATSARFRTPDLVTAVLVDEWAALEVWDRDGDPLVSSRFALGAVTSSIVGELEERGGKEPGAVFVIGHAGTKSDTVARWLGELADELDVDLRALAELVLSHGVDGPVSAEDFSPSSSPSLMCELRCRVSTGEVRDIVRRLRRP